MAEEVVRPAAEADAAAQRERILDGRAATADERDAAGLVHLERAAALRDLRPRLETWIVCAPVLGVEMNEDEVARHPYVPDFRNQYTFADGSVADA